jgi:predicted ATPase
MKLLSVEIEGYRSIRNRLLLRVEPNVTVILGPNDHGKTNILNALLHLNADAPFDPEDDLNWDCDDRSSELPVVKGIFELSVDDRELLLTAENEYRETINAKIDDRDADAADQDVPVATPPAIPVQTLTEPSMGSPPEQLPTERLPPISMAAIPNTIELKRCGISGVRTCLDHYPLTPTVLQTFAHTRAPRIELIDPMTRLSDSVSLSELRDGQNEFMRGIFYYAGLVPDQSDELFVQNDKTQKRLTAASALLDATLRETWSQGQNLHFQLRHHSKNQAIDLLIEDPSVDARFVRASRRSSGFTHYFSLKTILHARQRDHEAASYILLFDEPGVFLHPSGQRDLLMVLETLSQESQVLYVTHSLFMINKTFPTRHRLLMKDTHGTTLDGKPYVGRWHAVLTSFGLTLTGSILFAQNVLLTEGDSDPIYLYALIQKAVASGHCHLDLNALAIMSTSESRNAEALLRLLLETHPRPRVAMLVDGDKGGKDRRKYLEPISIQHQIPVKTLPDGTTIEDHIPMLKECFVPAVAHYVGNLMVELEAKAKPDEEEFKATFILDFEKAFEDNKVTKGLAEWVNRVAREIGGLKEPPSKVGIAREYSARLLEIANEDMRLDNRARSLIEWLHVHAGVPEMAPVEKRVIA